jgi:capsular polysaccharide biosynthesis protein
MRDAIGYRLIGNGGDDESVSEMRAHAAKHDLSLVGLYGDPTQRNGSFNRTGLVAALTVLRKSGGDALIVSTLQDVFSNRTDAEYFAANGMWRDRIRIYAAREGIDTGSPEGKSRLKAHVEALGDEGVDKIWNRSKKIGSVGYLDILRQCHEILDPDLYVEIGLRFGKSMELSRCRAIGVDPKPRVRKIAGNSKAEIFSQTSDEFFSQQKLNRIIAPGSVDLAFIDGMHLFDFVLRDFINIERRAHSRTIIAIDDVCPRNALEAMPERIVTPWAGDVWKLIPCLRQYRPDLELVLTDAHPTGIALIAGLDAASTVLTDHYAEIMDQFKDLDYVMVGDYRDFILQKYASDDPYIAKFLTKYKRKTGESDFSDAGGSELVSDPVQDAMPHQATIHLAGKLPRISMAARSVSSWMDRPFLPPRTKITRFDSPTLVRCNGYNKARIFDAGGRSIEASIVPRSGYGRAEDHARVRRHGGRVLRDQGRYIDLDDAARITSRPDIELIAGETLLLGYLDKRFGHFLTEGLSRAWALERSDMLGRKVLVWSNARLPAFQREALALLGVAEDQLVVADRSLRFEQLLVPSRAYRLTGAASPALNSAWDRMRDAALLASGAGNAPKDVFLSRSGNPKRRLLQEAEVEDIFAGLGFTIVRPESLPFAEQVALVGRCERLAGCFGSQMHLSMFMRPGTKKFVIASGNFVYPDEAMIGAVKGVPSTFHLSTSYDPSVDLLRAEWSVDVDRLREDVAGWLS